MKSSQYFLNNITKRLVEDTGLQPIIATEIEFYFASVVDDEWLAKISSEIRSAKIPAGEITKEKGEFQYEVALLPSPTPAMAAENLLRLKKILASYGADFTPKPHENQPGSGLHIHISLLDKDGKNVFEKSGDEEETEIMLHSIGGLLATMKESMVFFAPNEESYKRFNVPAYNKQSETYNNSPVNVSWGGNNRTTAVRIPTSTVNPSMRHIEHRVAGTDADPFMVIAVILAGIHHGITQTIDPGEKIYGNAYEPQYRLELLPKSLVEATQVFDKSEIIKGYINNSSN